MVTFRFPDLPAKRRSWWLVLTPEAVDVCDFDPGYEVGGGVTGRLRDLVLVWRGDIGGPGPAVRAVVAEDPSGPRGSPGLVPAVAVRRGAPCGAGHDPLSRAVQGLGRVAD